MVSLIELAALVVAIIAGVVAWVQAKEDNVKAYIAVIVMMVGASLTMTASLRFEQIPNINERLSFGFLNPRAEQLLEEYAGAATVVGEATDAFFDKYFLADYNDFLRVMRDAQEGRFVVEAHEIDVFANEVIASARDSVVATSYVSSAAWWDTPWGQKYEQLNYEKVRQGVKITRYFLFSDEQERQAAEEMLQRQVANGVKVFVVNARDTSHRYWDDVIVIDNSIGGELHLTPEKTIESVTMYTWPEDLQRLRGTVEGLRVRSRPVVPSEGSR